MYRLLFVSLLLCVHAFAENKPSRLPDSTSLKHLPVGTKLIVQEGFSLLPNSPSTGVPVPAPWKNVRLPVRCWIESPSVPYEQDIPRDTVFEVSKVEPIEKEYEGALAVAPSLAYVYHKTDVVFYYKIQLNENGKPSGRTLYVQFSEMKPPGYVRGEKYDYQIYTHRVPKVGRVNPDVIIQDLRRVFEVQLPELR